LGTSLFLRFSITILIIYLLTVVLLGGALYYALKTEGANVVLVMTITVLLVALNGYMIAKMAIDPLKEHFTHLEHFAKETLHELNLPIGTITANTHMLRKSMGENEKNLKRLDRIEAASVMLQERYNELSYLIARQMQHEVVERFDLAVLVQERVTFLQPLYSQVRFVSSLESTWVNLDRIGLRKVIDNLIDNAVKYSDTQGEVRLRLKSARLEIEDRGKGMDEMQLVRIFDRYYQSDATMPGFGIGLGLVKRFCDHYKIALNVHSRQGEGTTILLNFSKVI